MEFLFFIQAIFTRFINLGMVLPVVWRSRAISKQNKRPVSAEKFAQSLHILRDFLNVKEFYMLACTNKACQVQLSLTDKGFCCACNLSLATTKRDFVVYTRHSMIFYTRIYHDLFPISNAYDENQEYFCCKMSLKVSISNGFVEITTRCMTKWDHPNRKVIFTVKKYNRFEIQSSQEIVTFA